LTYIPAPHDLFLGTAGKKLVAKSSGRKQA
jgi:hypothetical protein